MAPKTGKGNQRKRKKAPEPQEEEDDADAPGPTQGCVGDAESDDDEAEDDDDDAEHNDMAAKMGDIDPSLLSSGPPPRACTIKCPSKLLPLASPKGKKIMPPPEMVVDGIFVLLGNMASTLKSVEAKVTALAEKETRNTRSIVDLTQLSATVASLTNATNAASTAVAAVKVEAQIFDPKKIEKFVAKALSDITMWPKVEAPMWLKSKQEAFGAEIASKPELDCVSPPILFFIFLFIVYVPDRYFLAGS